MRVFIASGISSLICKHNANVTLIDLSPGLPNAGYLFALPPNEYLKPVIERGAFVRKDVNGSLRIACARESDAFEPFKAEFSEDGAAHFIIEAFDTEGRSARESCDILSRLARLCSLRAAEPRPEPAVVLITDGSKTVADSFGPAEIAGLAPRAAVLTGVGNALSPLERSVVESIRIPPPDEIISDRRIPPEGEFISGFVNSMLQRISSGSHKDRESVSL